MKDKIHPTYKDVTITCNCGNKFVTRSTLGKDQLTIEICSQCHPFYTGTQKLVDSGGRVDRFRQKYGKKEKVADKTEETKKENVEAKSKEQIKPESVETKTKEKQETKQENLKAKESDKSEIETKKKKSETKKKTTVKKKETDDKQKK